MSKLDGKLTLGADKYILTFNVNTFCDLEEAFEVVDVNAVLETIQSLETKPSLRTIRKIFFVALAQEHPEITLKQTGDLISEVGIGNAADALMQAISQAFPNQSAEGNVVTPAGSGKKS